MKNSRLPPLDGILVLDFGQVYNGPYCGLLLGYLGARVIKIEPPAGDIIRGRQREGEPYPFLWLNSNKESITIDLQSAAGRDIVRKLATRADVLIENFTVGVMERHGVGWEQLRPMNPRLIYASGKGYGLDGPYRDYPAMDLTIQAVSGAMNATGFPDGPPVKAGPAICDFMGGVHLCVGVLAAIIERQRSGEGQLVESSMQEAVLMSLASAVGAMYDPIENKVVPPRTGNQHPGLSMAPYNVYETADGYIAIICVAERHWHSLAEVIGRPEMTRDTRFSDTVARAEHIDEIDDAIGTWTRLRGKVEIQRLLVDAGVPCAPVKSVEEAMNDPHLIERRFWQDIPHGTRGSVRLPTSPIRFGSSTVRGVERLAPKLGADTENVLSSVFGFSTEDLEHLRNDGAFGRTGRAESAS
ncbi:MAG: CoA transferase [Rhodospirillales bacterium]